MSWSFPRLSNLWLGFALLLVGHGGLVVANSALADVAQDEARIKYRQTLMPGVGSNMGGIGDILKHRLDLPGHVESHARQLAESSKLIGSAFEAEVTSGATDAKQKVWQDWEGFEAAIAKFEKAARALETAAAGRDRSAVGPAVKALGKSCGGCHDTFRKPKEESYKNR